MTSSSIGKFAGLVVGSVALTVLAYRKNQSLQENDLMWYRQNMPHFIQAAIKDRRSGNSFNLGSKSDDSVRLHLKGPSTFLNRIDIERNSEESILEIVKEVSQSEDIDVIVSVNLRNVYDSAPGNYALLSRDNDEEGNASNVSNLHYCDCCGKDSNILPDSGKCKVCLAHKEVHR